MDYENIYQAASKCEPDDRDGEIVNFLMSKDYDDMGEAISMAYLVGKIVKERAYEK